MAKTDYEILTGLTGKKNYEILLSVIGQLSDGIWENSPKMSKYWTNADIIMSGEDVIIVVNNTYDSAYHSMTDDGVRNWFGNKVKQVIKTEIADDVLQAGWARDNKEVSDYMGYEESITVADCYKAYEVLLGRNIAGRYEGNMKKEDLEVLIVNAHNASIITEEETTVLKEALKDMVDADALQLGEELEDALMDDQALNDEVITLAAMLCTVSETLFTERQMFQAAKRARLAELNRISLTGVEVYKTVKKPRFTKAIKKWNKNQDHEKVNAMIADNTITAYHPVLRIEFNGTAYSFSYNRLDLSLAFNEAGSPLNWFNFRHELSNLDFDQTKTKQHIELIVPYIKQVLGIR